MDEQALYGLNQIALSVRSVQHTQRWYRDNFGFLEAGGTSAFIPIFGSADVQGVPGATSECWWLNDAQENFQIELFEFRRPVPAPMPDDWRPCDIGYTTIGLQVDDFDAVLARLAHRRVPLLSAPVGELGERRVCVRDPDGVLLEILEAVPDGVAGRPRVHEVPVAVRFVTLSVPDLARARHTWLEVLGWRELVGVELHTPEHEALWGLAGARRTGFVADAGGIALEVVQYAAPVGAPWPQSYRISDLGIVNISLGLPTGAEHAALVQRCIAHGLNPNSTRPTPLKKLWYAVYVNDPMGFSIELLYHRNPGRRALVNPLNLVELGFVPRPAPVARARAVGFSAAPASQVWAALRGSDMLAGVTRVTSEEPYRLEYTHATWTTWMQHGFVTLELAPRGGTRIVWECQYRSPVPGRRRRTERRLADAVQRVVARSEDRLSPGPVSRG